MSHDTDDNTTPDKLKRSMVRLADTVRTVYVIGHRIRNGLSSDQLPDPVLRDYDHIGSTDRSDSNGAHPVNDEHYVNHITKGLYNAKIKPRKRASYEPYL